MARRQARRAAETPEWLRDTPEEAAALRLRLLKRHQMMLGRCFKERRRARLDHYKERQELERANADMAEDLKEWAGQGWSRLRCIWWAVIDAENEHKWLTSPTLSQAARIAATPRVRGCGAAAKKAGFAG